MFNLSNCLSFLRAPLAFLFLVQNPLIRVSAILIAMLTDSLDGYFARRYKQTSKFGVMLDPAMDKFFVFFALIVLLSEGRLEVWQMLTMLSRDCALCIFGLYLKCSGRWHNYQFRAFKWGKITTALQFIALVALTLNYHLPNAIFLAFILFGILALTELLQFKKTAHPV
jgi:CDP-diacylglycerol--glycerol-3-phosphate 3-phosphatidyltransferase